MNKYRMMVVLDLDISVQEQIKAQDIERYTEDLLRVELEKTTQGIKIQWVRAKSLAGMIEEEKK